VISVKEQEIIKVHGLIKSVHTEFISVVP